MVPKTVDPEVERRRAIERRRRVFFTLLVAVGATLVLGLIPALRPLLWVHVFADAALGAFVGFLISQKKRSYEEEFATEPRVLRPRTDSEEHVEPEFVLESEDQPMLLRASHL